MEFGVIRHARTAWNLEKRIQGKTDMPLCDQGIMQAENWAAHLADSGFEIVVSSAMQRALQTAVIIADHLKLDLRKQEGLIEQDFGDWEGKRLNELSKNNPEEIRVQEARGWDFEPPGGESRCTVLKRVEQALEQLEKLYYAKKLLIVTHSSVMKIIVYHALNRKFLPGEKRVLKDYHLHLLDFEKSILIKQLNAVDLEKGK